MDQRDDACVMRYCLLSAVSEYACAKGIHHSGRKCWTEKQCTKSKL